MLKEFKEFALRGNVVDMAVGIIIGGAFGLIVKVLVSDVIMPPIGLLLGDVDFSNLFLVLKEGTKAGPYVSLESAKAAGAVTINYGVFTNSVISFLIVAFAVFLLIRGINKMKREEEKPEEAPTSKDCEFCFTSIRLKRLDVLNARLRFRQGDSYQPFHLQVIENEKIHCWRFLSFSYSFFHLPGRYIRGFAGRTEKFPRHERRPGP